jgi:hypothetical protein
LSSEHQNIIIDEPSFSLFTEQKQNDVKILIMTLNTQTSDDHVTSNSWISDHRDEISEGEVVSRRVFSDTVARTFGANEYETEKVPSVDEFLSQLGTSSRPSSGTFALEDAERRRFLSSGSIGSDNGEWLRELLSSASARSAASPASSPPHPSSFPPNQLQGLSQDSARDRVASSDSLSFLDVFSSPAFLGGFSSPRVKSSSSESDVSKTETQTEATEGENEPPIAQEDEAEEQSEPYPTETISPQVPVVGTTRTRSQQTPSTTTSRGPVEVTTWDFLTERGGRGNNHIGNKRVHKLLSQLKKTYRRIKSKQGKTHFVHAIVAYVMSYGGRFLQKDTNGNYFEMTSAQARIKLSQCIRENKQLKWTTVDFEDEDTFMEFYRQYILR